MRKLIKVLAFIFTDRQMLSYFSYALLVLCVLFALSFAAFYPLIREAKLVVTDTMVGLVYGAELNSVMDDNFVRLLLMTDVQFANESNTLLRQIERDTRENEAVIEKYQESIHDDESRKSWETFVTQRNNFIANRKQFLERLQANPDKLNAELKSTLLPAFEKYRDAGRGLIDFNARIAQERSVRIQKLAFSAVVFTIVGPVLIVFFGTILGIKLFKL